MKLSFKTILPILLISAMLILLIGCFPPPLDDCVNNNPTITSIPDKDIAQGDTFNFTVSANDPDGDNLFYEIVSGPPTMTINSSTGAITWVAACTEPMTGRCHIICSKEVTVKVTDDGCGPLSDQDTFIINVWDQLP